MTCEQAPLPRDGGQREDALGTEVERAYAAMLRLLTRREYSVHELRQKLGSRFPDGVLEQALELCRERNYQSDARCAAMLVRHCEFSLTGPNRLRHELHRRGVQADGELMPENETWEELAFRALCRRFGQKNSAEGEAQWDYACRRRALAYLVQRGFTPEQCLSAVRRFAPD